jgi:Repeat of unknown function (DUF5648)
MVKMMLTSLIMFTGFIESHATYNHFWTVDKDGEGRSGMANYKKEGIAFYSENKENGIPIYRWSYGDYYFWTTNKEGENLDKSKYKNDGVVFYGTNVENGVPIYRWRGKDGSHFYTTDKKGEKLNKKKFKLEGVAFYAAKSGIPVYRWHYKQPHLKIDDPDVIISNNICYGEKIPDGWVITKVEYGLCKGQNGYVINQISKYGIGTMVKMCGINPLPDGWKIVSVDEHCISCNSLQGYFGRELVIERYK